MTPTETAYLAACRDSDPAEQARLAQLVDAEQAANEHRLTHTGALHAAALWYATRGIPVFPCAPGGKRPATRHGFKDATTSPDQIRAWWKVRPDYNIGIPTGHRFDVFDVDGPEGLIAIHDFIDGGGFPQVLAKAHTPRGRHYYVPTAGRGNGTGLLPKVDYRGDGGYVIAPPSRTPDGTYRWFHDHPLNPERIE